MILILIPFTIQGEDLPISFGSDELSLAELAREPKLETQY